MSEDKVQAELAKWLDGEMVARRTFPSGTHIAVTRGEDGYSVFRAFPIGDGAGVSVDMQDESVEDALDFILNGDWA